MNYSLNKLGMERHRGPWGQFSSTENLMAGIKSFLLQRGTCSGSPQTWFSSWFCHGSVFFHHIAMLEQSVIRTSSCHEDPQ